MREQGHEARAPVLVGLAPADIAELHEPVDAAGHRGERHRQPPGEVRQRQFGGALEDEEHLHLREGDLELGEEPEHLGLRRAVDVRHDGGEQLGDLLRVRNLCLHASK